MAYFISKIRKKGLSMKQKMDPSFNEEINENLEKMTIVRHLPDLPPASGLYKYNVFYNQKDTCFYRCVLVDGDWTWQRVTYGTKRPYILPVCWIVGDFTFDIVVDTIKKILKCLKEDYNDIFEDMVEGEDGVSGWTVIEKYNELATYFNRRCEKELPKAAANSLADEATLNEFVKNYLNKLISVLNPHANMACLKNFVMGIANLDESLNAEEAVTVIRNMARISITEMEG